MRIVSFGVLALASLGIVACDIEAGSNPSFPPVGGIRTPVIAPTDTFLPSEQPSEAEMTASLSSAVDAALAATNVGETPLPPVSPRTTVQTGIQIDPVTGQTITSDDGVLNLSLQSQEEQRIAREADAAAIQAAAAQRVVIAPGQMPDVIAGVNIIAYARSTTNSVGQRIIRRPNIRRTSSRSQCAKFDTVDNAQRNFLANGGPEEDPLNLDPDGDGFACRWSPDAYRALNL